MAITAQSIIRRAFEVLQDTTAVRWPTNELVRWLNDAQREVVLYRPDAMATNATITCASGTKQTLPTNGAKLINVVRNANHATKRAVRLIEREVLDSQTPNWHSLTESTVIYHYMFDPRDPRTFYVYPPAANTVQLDIVYSAYPTDIAEPAAGTDYTAVSGNISVPDIYANALLDYVLYRAYSKDSEYAGNAQRAQAHYVAFANSLGIEIKGTLAAGPSLSGSVFNPNAAKPQVAG